MRNNKLISVLVAIALVFAFATTAWAVATPANSEIVNTATVTYTNQATTAFSVSATVRTTVSEVAAIPTLTTASKTVAPGQTVPNYIAITNNGNWVSQFDVSVPNLNPSATYGAAGTVALYVNSVATATSTTMDVAPVLLLASGAAWKTPYIDSINSASSTANASAAAALAALGSTIYPNGTVVFFVITVPSNASSTATLQKTITITPSKDPVTKTPGPRTIVDTVAAPTLTVTKGVANIGNASTAAYAGAYAATATGAPGDVLEYQVVITNTGNASATATALVDAIDTNTTLLGYTTGVAAAAVDATVINSAYSVAAGTNTTTYTGSTLTNLALQLTDSALVGAAAGSVDNAAVITLKYRVVIN